MEKLIDHSIKEQGHSGRCQRLAFAGQELGSLCFVSKPWMNLFANLRCFPIDFSRLWVTADILKQQQQDLSELGPVARLPGVLFVLVDVPAIPFAVQSASLTLRQVVALHHAAWHAALLSGS